MRLRHLHILIFIFFLISNSITAQNSIQLIPESSSIRVFGTSNIHDWEMHVEFQAKVSDYEIPNNSIKDLKDIQFKIEGTRLKSQESTMEKKAHKALKLPEFPFISFLLKKITIRNHKTTSFNAFAIGTLVISGQSRDVKLPINGNFLGEKKLNLTGHIDLNMSDFKIEAPTAFFGAISTADEIKILYSLDFTSKQKLTQEMLSSNLNP
ncbi:YceI family protein [Ancylomarina sp. YFZ004]